MLADAKVTCSKASPALSTHRRLAGAGYILIATGGTPSHPPIEGPWSWPSNNENSISPRCRAALVVLGAGYVRSNSPAFFCRLWQRVSLAYRAPTCRYAASMTTSATGWPPPPNRSRRRPATSCHQAGALGQQLPLHSQGWSGD